MSTNNETLRRRPTAAAVSDLLFEQMNRLNNTALSEDELGKEVRRADAMCDLAAQIISNNRVHVEAWKVQATYGDGSKLPPLIPAATAAPAAPRGRLAAAHERA